MSIYTGTGSQFWNTMGKPSTASPLTTKGTPHTTDGGTALPPLSGGSGGSTGTGGTGTPATPAGGSSSPQLSAYDILSNAFKGFGMSITPDLDAIIKQMMAGGYTPDNINLFMPDIQKTAAFQARFPGFSKRIANGYNALSVSDYLNLEDQYHAILQHNGMPSGFYDDHSDFGQWIANDVSPDEVQNRAQLAVNAVKAIDPTTRNLMTQFYGLGTGDLAAYFLDPSRALPTIERQYNAAGVASWAQRNGFAVDGMAHYEDLVDKGVTADQAAQGYGSAAQLRDTVGRMAGTYGQSYGQSDAENDVFFNQSEKRQKIVDAERTTFSGSGRAASTGSSSRNAY